MLEEILEGMLEEMLGVRRNDFERMLEEMLEVMLDEMLE